MDNNKFEKILRQIYTTSVNPSEELVLKTKERVLGEFNSSLYTKKEVMKGELPIFKQKPILAKASIAVFAVCILLFTLYRSIPQKDVYAYIDVDINPSFEMVINSDNIVVEVKPFNKDAKTLLKELKLNGRSLGRAMEAVLEKSNSMGFIQKHYDNMVFIYGSLDENVLNNKDSDDREKEKLNLDRILSEVEYKIDSFKEVDISTEAVVVEPDIRKFAYENGMSIVRYLMFKETDKRGLDYTIEDIKTRKLSDLVESLKNKDKNNDDTTIDKEAGKATPIPTADVKTPISIHGAASDKPVQEDGIKFDWENGSTHGFITSSSSSAIFNTSEKSFSGTRSIRWDISAVPDGKFEMKKDCSAIIPAGATVVFRVWVPSDAPIKVIQPYVMPHGSDYKSFKWYANWAGYESLKKDEWNKMIITLPKDMDMNLEQQIGVQCETTNSGTIALYVDSINW